MARLGSDYRGAKIVWYARGYEVVSYLTALPCPVLRMSVLHARFTAVPTCVLQNVRNNN